MSRALGVPFLGAIPLDADVVTGGDEGRPIVVDKPQSAAARAYAAIAAALAAQLHAALTIVLKPFIWRWDSNQGAPRAGERGPAVGLADDGDWLSSARPSDPVRALGGRSLR